MKTIIAAIEQETKYVEDSLEGDRQYRKGYVQALEAVSAFLIGQSGGWSSDADNPAVQRLFASLHFNPKLCLFGVNSLTCRKP